MKRQLVIILSLCGLLFFSCDDNNKDVKDLKDSVSDLSKRLDNLEKKQLVIQIKDSLENIAERNQSNQNVSTNKKNENKTVRGYKFSGLGIEVYPKDLGELNWHDANAKCLRIGWRLPTKHEAQQMFSLKTDLKLKNEYYWTSSEDGDGGHWTQNMVNDLQYKALNRELYFVRPVRSL